MKNTASSYRSMAAGTKCHAKHALSIVIGDGLTSDEPNQLKIGNFTAKITEDEWNSISEALSLAFTVAASPSGRS